MQQTETELQRTHRKEPTYPDIDYTVPIDIDKYMADVQEGDCYTHLWDMDNEKCRMCGDSVICGLLYHTKQNNAVNKLEKKRKGFMDLIRFDDIERDKLLIWLKLKPRTVQEMFDYINAIAKCPDEETVVYWIKSFIVEHPNLTTKKGIVIVRNND